MYLRKIGMCLSHLGHKEDSLNFFKAWAAMAIMTSLSLSFINLLTTTQPILSKEVGITAGFALLLTLTCAFILLNLTAFSKFKTKFPPKVIIGANVSMLMLSGVASTFFFISACVFTPFRPIDTLLHQIDLRLGFEQNYWVELIYSQSLFHKLLEIIYFSLYGQMIVLPLIAVLIVPAEKIYRCFGCAMMLGVIGTFIYYFFPTIAPTLFLDPYTLAFDQLNLVTQFEQIHAGHLPDHFTLAIIGFPSYHVIWALLICYLFKDTKIFVPILILNITICLTTVLLGWHYILDAVASCVLVTFSLLLTNKALITESNEKLQSIENKMSPFMAQRENSF